MVPASARQRRGAAGHRPRAAEPRRRAPAGPLRERPQPRERLLEEFAGFLDHTDAEIGRLVQFLKETGDLDNTILIVTSDNGSSQEGEPQGITDEARYSHPFLDDLDTIEEHLEDIGGPHSSPNYP